MLCKIGFICDLVSRQVIGSRAGQGRAGHRPCDCPQINSRTVSLERWKWIVDVVAKGWTSTRSVSRRGNKARAMAGGRRALSSKLRGDHSHSPCRCSGKTPGLVCSRTFASTFMIRYGLWAHSRLTCLSSADASRHAVGCALEGPLRRRLTNSPR